jgi:hypothetical protein
MRYSALVKNKQQLEMAIVLEKLNGALAGSIGLVSETIAAYRKQEENAIVGRIQDSGLSGTLIIDSMCM